MKKRKNIIKRTFSIILAFTVLFSGIPVYGQTDFTPGNEETESLFEDGTTGKWSEEPAFSEGEGADFSEEAEYSAFSDETALFDENGIRYIKGRPLTEEEKAEQLAPFGELVPLGEAPSVGSDLSRSTYALYPERYDARERGLITEVKNQNPFGICWAFGMASLMETSLLSQNRGAYDLSEEHLAYFMVNRENDPLGNTPYDINEHLGDGYHEGGHDYLASIFLTTWEGMTTEKNVPLPTDENHTADYTVPISPKKAYDAEAYLTDASFSDYSVDRMKQMLVEDNSVAVTFRMIDRYYNEDTGAYCCPQKNTINHVVTIVGWDDHYSRENFSEECGVTTDGAWIVKNSWGAKWGDGGYFYLSYEDKTISSLVSVNATDRPQYQNNYFYDGSSGLSVVPVLKNQFVSNIFEVKAGKGAPEMLGEVNVVTWSDNWQYTIQIYTDLKDPSNPASGTPAYKTPYKVSQPLAGVKTIKVPEVLLKPGTKYSVVIKNTGEAGKFCCEADYQQPWFQSHAGIERGQGFWADSKGAWTDLKTKSATPRIKAHTRTLNELAAPKLKAASKEYNKIALSWNKGAGADGYLLYRGEAGGKKKQLADLSPNAVSYTDNGVKTGVKYSYSVIPYLIDGRNVVKGQESSTVTAVPTLRTPTVRVRASANGYNIVGWSGISGATAYRIYRRTPTGSWKLLNTVNSKTLKYYDKSVSAGTSFAYTVRAYRKNAAGAYLSKYMEGDVIKTAPANQKVSSAVSEASGIRIKWPKQKNCDGYRIYRKKKGGSWDAIKTISSGNTISYLDKTAQKGVSYYYAVRAYVKEPYGTLFGNYTASSVVKRK